MSISTHENLKNAYLLVLRFSSRLKEAKGAQEEPWDYVNYSALVAHCLKIIEPLMERSLPVRLLEEAYRIQTNPRFFYGKKVVEYRYTTRHYALKLTEIFEKTCTDPSETNINILSGRWTQLASEVSCDYEEAKKYFQNN